MIPSRTKYLTSEQENQKLQADLSLRLENLQSEIRILSTGVEEYKEFLKRPSKEMDRIKEEMEGRLRTLEEKRKNPGGERSRR